MQGNTTFNIIEAIWTGPNGFSSVNNTVQVTDPGTYTFDVTDVCGNTASGSITLTAEDFLLPQPVVDITVGDLDANCNRVLTAEGSNFTPEASFSWGATNGPVLGVSEAGTFTSTLTDGCGQVGTASVTLTEDDFINPLVPSVSIMAQDDPNLECGMILTAVPGDDDVVQGFLWSTGETMQTITVEAGGEVSVTLTANCDQVVTSETLTLSLVELDFPNIFFPESQNDGGVNNTFGPENNCPMFSDYRLEVYNRWGRLVFEADNIAERWSGTLMNQGGEFLEEDVYLWQASYVDATGDKSQHGSITMVRR